MSSSRNPPPYGNPATNCTPGPGHSKSSTNAVEEETILGGFDTSSESDSDLEILDEFVNYEDNICQQSAQSLTKALSIPNDNLNDTKCKVTESKNHNLYGNVEEEKVGQEDEKIAGGVQGRFCDQQNEIKIEEIMIEDDDNFVKEITPNTAPIYNKTEVLLKEPGGGGDKYSDDDDEADDGDVRRRRRPKFIHPVLFNDKYKYVNYESKSIQEARDVHVKRFRRKINTFGPRDDNCDKYLKSKIGMGPYVNSILPILIRAELSRKEFKMDQHSALGIKNEPEPTMKEINSSSSSQANIFPETKKVEDQIKIEIEVDPVDIKPVLDDDEKVEDQVDSVDIKPVLDEDEYDDLTTNNNSVIFSGSICETRLPRLSDLNFNLSKIPTHKNELYNNDLNLNEKTTAINIHKISEFNDSNKSNLKCKGCNRIFSNYNQFVWHKYDRELICGNPKLVMGFESKSLSKSNICKPAGGPPKPRFKTRRGFKRFLLRNSRSKSKCLKLKMDVQKSLDNIVSHKRQSNIKDRIAESKNKGTNFNKYVCDICKIGRFENEVFLNLHKQLHEDPGFFTCLGAKVGCHFSGSNLDELTDHSMDCKLTKYIENKHNLKCAGPGPFLCLFMSCHALGFSTRSRLQISKHLQLVHNLKHDELFVCEFCESTTGYPNQKLLRAHIVNTHLNKIQCQIENCSKTFASFPCLTDHLLNFHHLSSASFNLYKWKFYSNPNHPKNGWIKPGRLRNLRSIHNQFCYFCQKYYRGNSHTRTSIIEQSRKKVFEQNLRHEYFGKSDQEIECLVEKWWNEDLNRRSLAMCLETKEEKIVRKRLEICQSLKKKGLAFDEESIDIHLEKLKEAQRIKNAKYRARLKAKKEKNLTCKI